MRTRTRKSPADAAPAREPLLRASPRTRGDAADAPTARRPRRTQAQRSQEMRLRILDAAVRVLGERGYAGFRTAEVAAVAGVSRGAQTHHFASKDELVLAALEHGFHTAAQRGRLRAGRVTSPDEAIRGLIEDSRDFFFSDVFLIAVDLAILGGRETPNNGEVREMSRSNRLPVEAAWLEALVESGVPRTIAEDLLGLTTSIVRGLAIRRLMADDPAHFDRLLTLWRTMVAEYLKAHTAVSPSGEGAAARRRR